MMVKFELPQNELLRMTADQVWRRIESWAMAQYAEGREIFVRFSGAAIDHDGPQVYARPMRAEDV